MVDVYVAVAFSKDAKELSQNKMYYLNPRIT